MLRADVRVHGFRVTPSPASCAWRWWRPSLAASRLLEALTQHLPSGRRRSASSRRRRTRKTEQRWLFEHPYSNWGIWQRVFNKRRGLHWACSICAERRAVLGENNRQFGRFFFFFSSSWRRFVALSSLIFFISSAGNGVVLPSKRARDVFFSAMHERQWSLWARQHLGAETKTCCLVAACR